MVVTPKTSRTKSKVNKRKEAKRGFRRLACKNRRFKVEKSKDGDLHLFKNLNFNKYEELKKEAFKNEGEDSDHQDMTIEQEIDGVTVHAKSKGISIDQMFDWREILKEEYKNEIIHKAHTFHKGRLKAGNTLKQIMKSKKWWWNNMGEDVSRFIKKWETWQIRTKNPNKEQAIKYIESDEVKERFKVDLVQLSDYLHQERRYLCNWVDHLSKFVCSRVIKSKTKEVVLAAIKEIFTVMGVPKILQSDNGGEFKNSLLEKYWSKVNVRQIFGSPYHPQSQGSVEAYNRTIQDFLISAKDALGKKFDLKDVENEFLVYYNERVHSTTGYTSKEIIERAKDSEFIQKIKENTTKSRRIKKDKDEKYKIGLKVRISNYRTIVKENGFIYYTAPSFVKNQNSKRAFIQLEKYC